MENSHNILIVDEFLEKFEKNWRIKLNSLQCTQIQLVEGSRLRPLMTLWGYLSTLTSYEMADLDYISRIAVSIELIHKATIILDDWIDEDEARHGKKAFHIEYDPYYAVIFALHMVSDALICLEGHLPKDICLSNSYYYCADIIARTIYSMSKGALEELRLNQGHEKLFDIDHIKLIAKLESSEIIGNAMQLGYFAGQGTNQDISTILKSIGDQFGYLFQAMNDMEVFANTKGLVKHKGAANNDFHISRKNIGVALLYNVAGTADKHLILDGEEKTIELLMKKYHILDFILKETDLFYAQTLKKLGCSALHHQWVEDFSIFMELMRQKAYEKLGLSDSLYPGTLKS